ncbi:hypothetical protein GH714_020287 [Hevea brasiliensis]|uniref:Uncharacterized protein n=1 Tax=Hevea brasiliensis TaxID=3981 RepID=A0A6A6LNC9_HEVBR|nr:hypothetical protein GH714_020287 [Hevea brasiliensis]
MTTNTMVKVLLLLILPLPLSPLLSRLRSYRRFERNSLEWILSPTAKIPQGTRIGNKLLRLCAWSLAKPRVTLAGIHVTFLDDCITDGETARHQSKSFEEAHALSQKDKDKDCTTDQFRCGKCGFVRWGSSELVGIKRAETDSLCLVHAVTGSSKDYSYFGSIDNDCKALLKELSSVQCVLLRNQTAHMLARTAV